MHEIAPPPPRKRIQPLRALRAIRALIRNPDDTAKVFDVIDSLSGNAGERSFQRFLRTPEGQRILTERRNLLTTLDDHESLKRLPAGTLGHVYADFVEREKITGQGLADASMTAERRIRELDADRELFFARLRDMHDLWHVATGYNRDLVGEAALLAFSYAQTRNRGVGFIVAVAWLKAGRELTYARPLIEEGYRRGKSVAWLPGQDWEWLLTQPLAAVRQRLGLGEPPAYEQQRSSGAPVLAA